MAPDDDKWIRRLRHQALVTSDAALLVDCDLALAGDLVRRGPCRRPKSGAPRKIGSLPE